MTTAISADRFRVGPPSPGRSAMRLVTDRVRSESFWVYTTFTIAQRLSGHEDGRWYFKPLGHEGFRPVSISYPDFEAAVTGLLMTQEFKDLPSDEAKRTPRPH